MCINLVKNFLHTNYKSRTSFLGIEETTLFKDKSSIISEKAWMTGYKAITEFPFRNFHLDPIRRFFIKYIMSYKDRIHFGEMIFAFD